MATSTYELLVAPERQRQQPQSNTATPQTATPQTAAPQATTQPVQATPSVQSTPPPAAPTAAKAPQTVTPPLAARENSAGYPTTGDITNWEKAAGVNAAPQAPAAAQPAAKPKRKSYIEMLSELSPYGKDGDGGGLTEKEQKARKRAALITAIGDGISALSNLYFTTRYAPNAKQESLSAKMQERWEKMDKERKANEKERFNAYMHAMQLDDAADRADAKAATDATQQQFENDMAKEALGFKRDAAKREEELQPDRRRKVKAEADAAESKATWTPRIAEATVRQKNRSGSGGGGNSSGGRKQFDYTNTNGTPASVKQSNWDNDSYINQLWTYLQQYADAGGAQRMWNSVNEELASVGNRSTAADRKRAAIEEVFAHDYNPSMQDTLAIKMQDFDRRYSPRRSK